MADLSQAVQTPPGVPPQYWPTITAAAQQYGVRADLLAGVLAHESAGWDPAVIAGTRKGSSGEIGIAQFMPSTAAGLHVNPYDATSSINGAAQYLAQGYRAGGSWDAALRYYNSGSATGTPTAGYIPAVVSRMAPITDWLKTAGELPEATSPFSGPNGLPPTPGLPSLPDPGAAVQGVLDQLGAGIANGVAAATQRGVNDLAERWNQYYPHIFLWTLGIGLLALGTFGLVSGTFIKVAPPVRVIPARTPTVATINLAGKR